MELVRRHSFLAPCARVVNFHFPSALIRELYSVSPSSDSVASSAPPASVISSGSRKSWLSEAVFWPSEAGFLLTEAVFWPSEAGSWLSEAVFWPSEARTDVEANLSPGVST